MNTLIEKIKSEAKYIGKGIIKVDGFINHQIDPELTMAMGKEFVRLFSSTGITNITKVLTAETSGIAPAFATAHYLKVPLIFARKHKPITMIDGLFEAQAVSRTKGNLVNLSISREYLTKSDRILLIDDFLATASTINALISIVEESDAELCGIGCVIEKVFENGRGKLEDISVPIFSLAKIKLSGNHFDVF